MHCKHIQVTLVVSDNSLQHDRPKHVQALCVLTGVHAVMCTGALSSCLLRLLPKACLWLQ